MYCNDEKEKIEQDKNGGKKLKWTPKEKHTENTYIEKDEKEEQ